MMYDFSKHKFRCSSLGHLMTEPKSKSDKEAGNLSESAKTHLIDIFVSQQYGRQTDLRNKFIEKGLAVEEDAITVISRIKKTMLRKNDIRLSNEYITGEPDLFIGESVKKADIIHDAKSSWDMFTFMRNLKSDLNPIYLWQGRGYSWLSGAKEAYINYCLIDTPEPLIDKEQKSLWYQMGCPSEADETWQDAKRSIRRAMTYSDIPLSQRMIEKQVDLVGEWKDNIISKVIKGREFLVAIQKDFVK